MSDRSFCVYYTVTSLFIRYSCSVMCISNEPITWQHECVDMIKMTCRNLNPGSGCSTEVI